MSDSSREYIPGLIAGLHRGTIGRRDFMKRAAAAGLSAGLIGQVVGRYDASRAGRDAERQRHQYR